jgi:predicted transcriptional regulator of viral defense system
MADINAFLRSQPNQTANAKQVVEHFDSKPNSSATALANCTKYGWAERVSPGVYRWIEHIPKKRGNK